MHIVLTLTLVCTLSLLIEKWPPLVFFFYSMNWWKRGKKRENSNEFFTHGLGETIRVFNEVLSKMSCAIKLKFSFAIIWLAWLTKMTRNKSHLFKETTWVITIVCHWSACKCNNMQTWIPCFFGIVSRV